MPPSALFFLLTVHSCMQSRFPCSASVNPPASLLLHLPHEKLLHPAIHVSSLLCAAFQQIDHPSTQYNEMKSLSSLACISRFVTRFIVPITVSYPFYTGPLYVLAPAAAFIKQHPEVAAACYAGVRSTSLLGFCLTACAFRSSQKPLP